MTKKKAVNSLQRLGIWWCSPRHLYWSPLERALLCLVPPKKSIPVKIGELLKFSLSVVEQADNWTPAFLFLEDIPYILYWLHGLLCLTWNKRMFLYESFQKWYYWHNNEKAHWRTVLTSCFQVPLYSFTHFWVYVGIMSKFTCECSGIAKPQVHLRLFLFIYGFKSAFLLLFLCASGWSNSTVSSAKKLSLSNS